MFAELCYSLYRSESPPVVVCHWSGPTHERGAGGASVRERGRETGGPPPRGAHVVLGVDVGPALHEEVGGLRAAVQSGEVQRSALQWRQASHGFM